MRVSQTFGACEVNWSPHRMHVFDEGGFWFLSVHEAGRAAATERMVKCRVNNAEELRALSAKLEEAARRMEQEGAEGAEEETI